MIVVELQIAEHAHRLASPAAQRERAVLAMAHEQAGPAVLTQIPEAAAGPAIHAQALEMTDRVAVR